MKNPINTLTALLPVALLLVFTQNLHAQFTMGQKVCVNDNGTKRSGMITGTGYGGGSDYRVYFFDTKAYVAPIVAANITAGECPPSGNATCDCNNAGCSMPSYVTSLPGQVNVGDLELEVFKYDIYNELSEMRNNPKAYAAKLKSLKWSHIKHYTNGNSRYYVESVMFANNTSNANERLQTYYCHNNPSYVAEMEAWNKKVDEAVKALEQISGSLTKLTMNDKLDAGADMLSDDKGQINGALHKDSQGRNAFCRASKGGYKHRVGECLTSGTTKEGIIIGFLCSPGHRAILIDNSYDEVGIGVGFHDEDGYGYARVVIMTGDKDTNLPANPCN